MTKQLQLDFDIVTKWMQENRPERFLLFKPMLRKLSDKKTFDEAMTLLHMCVFEMSFNASEIDISVKEKPLFTT